MAKGFGMNKKQYINALTLIVEKYPKHKVGDSAKENTFLQQQEVSENDVFVNTGDSIFRQAKSSSLLYSYV